MVIQKYLCSHEGLGFPCYTSIPIAPNESLPSFPHLARARVAHSDKLTLSQKSYYEGEKRTGEKEMKESEFACLKS